MPKKVTQPVPYFFRGGGELGTLIRNFDWNATSLGPPENWAQSLKTIVSVILNSKQPMFLWWGDHLVQIYNDAYRPSMGDGNKHPKALGQNGEDCWPEIWHTIKPIIDRVINQGDSFWADDMLVPIYRNGRLEDVYWTFAYSPVPDDDGKISGVLVTCIETTQKVQDLKKLVEANKKLLINEQNRRNIIKHAPVAIGYLKGKDLIIEIANKKMLDLWGKGDLVMGMKFETAFPEYVQQGFLQILEDVVSSGNPFNGSEFKAMIEQNGSLQQAFFDFVYQPLVDADETVGGVMIIANDVTDIIHSREEIKRNENYLRQIIMKSPYVMLVLQGPEFVVEIGNQALFDYWGKDKEQTIGKRLLDVLPELADQPFPAILQEVMKTGKPYGQEELLNFFETEEGIIDKYVTFFYEPLFNQDGTVGRILVAAQDRTQAVKDRHEILRMQENLKLSLEAAELGTFDMDIRKGTLYWDNRCRELFGVAHSGEVSYEQDFVNGLHPEDRERITKIINDLFQRDISNGNYDVEYRTVAQDDGKVRWLRAKGKVSYDENDKPIRFIGSVLDITEAKLDDIRKNDFIGMVSHELKTPLTSLTALIQMVKLKLKNETDPFITGALDKANIQVKKMATLINGFLNVSRLESGKLAIDKQTFDLEGLILDIIKEQQISVTNHTITYKGCGLTPINADREKIGSVISNLISNAIKYSPNNKIIHVHCEQKDREVQVSVSDQGIGIKPKDVAQLFDRYYRVKDSRTTHVSGFGIGLYLCSEIIAHHHGKIWVESEPEIGSTFIFTLPRFANESS